MKAKEPRKDYSAYIVAVFALMIAVFVWMGWNWVKKDSDPKSVEESLKEELTKNPIKTNIPTGQTSPQNTNQSAAANQASLDASSSSAENSSELTQLENVKSDSSNSDSSQPTEEKSKTTKFESTKLKVSLDLPKETTASERTNLITVTSNSVSWSIKFYDNSKKKDFQVWYADHFNIKDVAKCSFSDGIIKVGTYESKQVKPVTNTDKCDGDGNYASNSEKSKVVKVEIGKETAENVNKILTSFKFTE
jgi:hypothetical protein